VSRRDIERLNAKQADTIAGMLRDNAILGGFSNKLIGECKKAHAIATEQQAALRLTVGLGKVQKGLEAIRELLGPYCVEVKREDLSLAEDESKSGEGADIGQEVDDADSEPEKQ